MPHEDGEQPGFDAGFVNESGSPIGDLVEAGAVGGDGKRGLRQELLTTLWSPEVEARQREPLGADWRRSAHRSVSASLAPSATNAAAKVRRIQAMTRGLPVTLSRTAAAHSP